MNPPTTPPDQDPIASREARFDTFLEHTAEGIYCVEFDPPLSVNASVTDQLAAVYKARCIECNKTYVEVFGFESTQECIGKTFEEINRGQFKAIDDFLKAWIESDYYLTNYPTAVTRQPGQTRHWNNNVYGVIRDGHVVCAWGNFSNVTEQRLVEEQLRESEERLRLALAAGDMSTWDVDIRTGNISYTRRNGQGSEEGESVTFDVYTLLHEHVHSEDHAKAYEAIANHLVGDSDLIEFDCRFRTRSKDFREYAIRGRVVRWNENGDPIHMSGTRLDVTEPRRLQAEQRILQERVWQAQKLESLGTLAGGIAHDFNNLLTGIVGNADLALDRYNDGSDAREELRTILHSAERAAELCTNLLAYSGGGVGVSRPYNASELVRDTANLLEITVAKKVSIEYNLDENLPSIEVDETQFRQVLMNLIINASEACREASGKIVVTTRSADAYPVDAVSGQVSGDIPEGPVVILTVEDNGIGMPPEVVQRIYDPFFTTKDFGHGLGMAAVLGIMRGHNAAIALNSNPDQGTTFTLIFPTVDEAPQSATQAATEPSNTEHRGTVLVVDDEEIVRNFAKTALTRAGYEVFLANNGLEAIAFYKENSDKVDVVLLDITMPELGGRETHAQLRELDPNVRVVFSSGYTYEDESEFSFTENAQGFIQKPYRITDLIATIARAFDEKP